MSKVLFFAKWWNGPHIIWKKVQSQRDVRISAILQQFLDALLELTGNRTIPYHMLEMYFLSNDVYRLKENGRSIWNYSPFRRWRWFCNLLIAHQEGDITGNIFGEGIYFSDNICQAIDYRNVFLHKVALVSSAQSIGTYVFDLLEGKFDSVFSMTKSTITDYIKFYFIFELKKNNSWFRKWLTHKTPNLDSRNEVVTHDFVLESRLL